MEIGGKELVADGGGVVVGKDCKDGWVTNILYSSVSGDCFKDFCDFWDFGESGGSLMQMDACWTDSL